jgi:cholesterol oxidase
VESNLEAVVIGTGFGGAITACRLANKWPGGRVLIFERGKRYPLGSFPRSPHDFGRNFWVLQQDRAPRPKRIKKLLNEGKNNSLGIFDIRNYRHMDVVLGAGLGGGSLIYANVFMIPPDHVFDDRWPSSCKRAKLIPYYEIAREVLGSRPIPTAGADPRRRIIRQELFAKVAKQNRRDSELVDINVFFGNDHLTPLPIGAQDKNRYGAIQTSCTYCGECDIGCNYHSKNTLDLNYLFVAEKSYNAKVWTEHLVEKVVPLDANGKDDVQARGANGFRVYYRNLHANPSELEEVVSKRVVVSCGSLGSTELILRCKEYFGTLPHVSGQLGHSFSGNGDFLSFVLDSKPPADPNYGPVITQRTDYNLFKDFNPERAFILEDASYPNIVAWFVEGVKPGFLRIIALRRFVHDLLFRLRLGKPLGSIGWALDDVFSGDASYHTCLLLCMGLDKSNGVMGLDKNHELDINWPYQESRSLYEAILQAGEEFRRTVSAAFFSPLVTWDWPFRKNITVHALGGCILASDSSRGVTSADHKTFGQVFGYEGLYVADGAIVPTAVGANPTATISALSEMVAEGITGVAPGPDL